MKCLVLGGGGFLGSHLCDKLLQSGYEVRVLERPNSKRYRDFHCLEKIEWFEGDFVKNEDLERAVPGCDFIYHLVATTLPKSSNENPVYDVETNIVGTLNLLNLAHKNKIKKVIFPSSGGTIYGVPETVPIKESHISNPLCSYGITKLAIEKYFHLYHVLYGLDYCILRLANPFGEHQRVTGAQGAVAVFLDKALRGETIEIWGDGGVVRDYIYVSDVVGALVKAIHYDGEERLFNIGSGEGHSLNDILEEIEGLLGRPVGREYTPSRALDVPVNVLDIERAERCLGWQPETSFRQGLERTLGWLKKCSEGSS
jgi:UDP-glucose 4-epimerase